MTINIAGRLGTTDRLLRAILGIALLGFALFCPWAASLGLAVQIVSGAVGAVLLWTATVNSCPIYRALGICTE